MSETLHKEMLSKASWLRECSCGVHVANNVVGNRLFMNHIADNK